MNDLSDYAVKGTHAPRGGLLRQAVVALAALAMAGVFVTLARWQDGKAQRAMAVQAQHAQRAHLPAQTLTPQATDAAALQDQPVQVSGTFEPAQQILLDNRQLDGRAGVQVLTPLRLDGSDVRVLVNRGWAPWGASRSQLPDVPHAQGHATVRGLAQVPSGKRFFLLNDDAEAATRLWTRLDMDRYRARLGAPLLPIVILQDADNATDALIRQWPAPEDRSGMHRAYAWQWYGLALGTLVFYGVAQWRRRRS